MKASCGDDGSGLVRISCIRIHCGHRMESMYDSGAGILDCLLPYVS